MGVLVVPLGFPAVSGHAATDPDTSSHVAVDSLKPGTAVAEDDAFTSTAWIGVVLLLGLLLWIVALKRIVKIRTAALTESEARLRAANRTLRLIGDCNQVLARATNESELLDAICRSMVQQGGYRLAWIGLVQPSNPDTLKPAAQAGVKSRAFDTFQPAREGDHDPAAAAMRNRNPVIARNIQNDPAFASLRRDAAQFDYAALAALPLARQGNVLGVLTVFAAAPDAFDTDEVGLLAGLADDVAHGIAVLRERAEHAAAESARQAAHQRLADIIDFLPDATFVIDEHKRVIAWNHACETLTGVSQSAVLGRGDYAYAEPFFGERRPILVDLLDQPSRELEEAYKHVARANGQIYAESFLPRLRNGRGAHLWGAAAPLFDREGRRCGAIEVVRDITEQKRTEQALLDSERKYRELVEHANSIILRWNSEGVITFLNDFGLRFFGYSAEDIFGRHVVGTIVPLSESSGRDLSQLMTQICGDPAAFEQSVNENMRRNGERVWISWTNRVVLDERGQVLEILSVGTDITEKKRATEALRQSEEQFRLIMENLADLVAVLDLDGRRLYNSPSYQRILGEPRRLLGSSSFEQVHPEDRPRVEAVFQETVRTGIGQRMEYRMMDQDGNIRHIESQGSVIRDARGRVSQVLVVSRDVTERRKAEEEIREMNVTLERRVLERTAELAVARDRAEESDRLKSAFLATMSHELRTPLNSVIGFTGIMLQGLAGPLNEEQTKQLGMVQGSARHLLALINDVLDISKIEAGQIEIHQTTFDLREAIHHVLQTVTPLAQKKALRLRMDVAGDIGSFTSDRRRFEQILLNLLSNAIKFTEAGEVTLQAEPVPGSHGPLLRFSVRDTGPGIKPEDLPILFQPFRQIDTGLTRRHEGTGLGLAICKRLVERLGGTVSVTSEWGRGSTFTFTLPVDSETTP